ncbi:MAG: NAD+ synthase [Thermoplasmata archaeon]
MLRPVLKHDTQQVISMFLRHHLGISGAKGIVIGMSGGLDSSVAAKLAVDALGAERVLGVLMPESSTPDDCMADARAMAEDWGIEVLEINIREMVNSISHNLGCQDKSRLGNIKARCRMMALYNLASERNMLVLGTGNKSELLTGYFTKWGDGGNDINILGDLYKTQIRELAGKIGIPETVIARVPSGDLWTGQTDEGELGIDYATLDRILLGIELGMKNPEIIKGAKVTKEQVAHVRKLVKKSVHKRRMGLIPKIGTRTVGQDWREADLSL